MFIFNVYIWRSMALDSWDIYLEPECWYLIQRICIKCLPSSGTVLGTGNKLGAESGGPILVQYSIQLNTSSTSKNTFSSFLLFLVKTAKRGMPIPYVQHSSNPLSLLPYWPLSHSTALKSLSSSLHPSKKLGWQLKKKINKSPHLMSATWGRKPLESRVQNQAAPTSYHVFKKKKKRGAMINSGSHWLCPPSRQWAASRVKASLQLVFIKEDGEKEQQCLLRECERSFVIVYWPFLTHPMAGMYFIILLDGY